MEVEINLETIAELIAEQKEAAVNLDAFLKETEGEMERLLLSARAKVDAYFVQVLTLLPFEKFHVSIDDFICIYLHKDSHDRNTALAGGKGYAVISHGNHDYALLQQQEGVEWQGILLEKLSDELLLHMVKRFDIFQREVEKELAKKLKRVYDADIKQMMKRQDEIDDLVAFLTES